MNHHGSYAGKDAIFNIDDVRQSGSTVSFTNSSQIPLTNEDDNEEDENLTPDEILNDISEIDSEIFGIRFNKALTNDQIIEQINKLMERRNKLSDQLQKVRNSEFKEFVESLKLHDIQITPFFPAPRRCKLQIDNEASKEILKAPSNEPQKKWGINLFKKKTQNEVQQSPNSSRSNFYTDKQIDQYALQYRAFNANIRANLQAELARIEKKKFLSPDEIALKLRIDAELQQLDYFSNSHK